MTTVCMTVVAEAAARANEADDDASLASMTQLPAWSKLTVACPGLTDAGSIEHAASPVPKWLVVGSTENTIAPPEPPDALTA
jgi:hypothetical protein